MTKFIRHLIIGSLASVIFPLQLFAMDDWQTGSDEEAGFIWNVGERLVSAFTKGELKNLHSVVVVRNSRLVVERYYEGFDAIDGRGIGNVKFNPDTLHDIQSITKSIVSLLYGIALAEGKVPGIETPLSDAFPAYSHLMADSDRRKVTVEHALTMTMGLGWDQSEFPYGDMRNSETAMWRAPDRIDYVLRQPIVSDPGSSFKYSSGATMLLGQLLVKGVGKPLLDYAREKLFDPLAITDVTWRKAGDEESAWDGLRMNPRDLAKIGQLVLNQGRWNGIQIVPPEWLESSFLESATVGSKFRYGYQWWLGPYDERTLDLGIDRLISASGYGDQQLIIIPARQLVIVINAGNYGIKGTKLIPRILFEHVLPALKN